MVGDDIKSQISEAMKKIVLTGVGTIFLTEESIRNFLGELKLPKELWSGFLENAAKTKQEFLATFARESAQVLSRIDLVEEARRFARDHKIRLSIEIAFEGKDGKTPEER